MINIRENVKFTIRKLAIKDMSKSDVNMVNMYLQEHSEYRKIIE